MEPKSRIDVWIEYELNKSKVMEALHVTPMTRNEIAKMLDLSKSQIHNIIRNLHSYGFIKVASNAGVVCSVSGRTMRLYMPTRKKYVGKDREGMKERSEARKAAKETRVPRVKKTAPRKKYDMSLRKAQMEKEELYEKAEKTVIKVNDHTTIYLNSKRSQKDYAWQKTGAKKHTPVSISSGLNLFGSW
jgi:predicted transcriptional regulator